MDLDQPLADIIASKQKTKRGRPGRGRGSSSASRGRNAGNAPKAQSNVAQPKPITAEAVKIIISNLPSDVTEAAVRDLMQSTVGPVRSVHMIYTSTGKSTGQATVLFKNKGDGNKAHTAYHNRMIDNQRPMKVEIALDPSTLVSLASRFAPAPAARGSAPTRRRGATSARTPRPAKKTAEQLDAEMADYKTTSA